MGGSTAHTRGKEILEGSATLQTSACVSPT